MARKRKKKSTTRRRRTTHAPKRSNPAPRRRRARHAKRRTRVSFLARRRNPADTLMSTGLKILGGIAAGSAIDILGFLISPVNPNVRNILAVGAAAAGIMVLGKKDPVLGASVAVGALAPMVQQKLTQRVAVPIVAALGASKQTVTGLQQLPLQGMGAVAYENMVGLQQLPMGDMGAVAYENMAGLRDFVYDPYGGY